MSAGSRGLRITLGLILGLWVNPMQAGAATEICIEKQLQEGVLSCPKRSTHGVKKKRRHSSLRAKSQSNRRAQIGKPLDARSFTSIRDPRPLNNRKKALLVTEIQSLERLLARTPPRAPDRPLLLRRLAEDYVELGRAASQEWALALANAEEMGGRRATEKKRRAWLRRAAKAKKLGRAARRKAIQSYTRLKNQYPKLKDLDEVLYYLAFEYEQAGQMQQARKVYYELIQRRPRSPYVSSAYLAFGELFFREAQADPKRWPLAENAYQEALKLPPPKNRVYGYALYKLAYVFWNQKRYEDAFDGFKRVIEHARRHPSLSSSTQLARVARTELVIVYAQFGEASAAFEHFAAVSGDAAGESRKTIGLLERLGQSYLDLGRYGAGVALYRELERRGDEARQCYYQSQVTRAISASRSGDKRAVKAQLERLLEARRRHLAGNYSQKEALACSNTTAELVVETAMSWHLEAVGTEEQRGTGDEKSMDLAAELYQEVVKGYSDAEFRKFRFPRFVRQDWPTLDKVRYAMADLLYARSRWADCAAAFDAVVRANPGGSDAAEAAYAAALCYQKLYEEKYAARVAKALARTPEADKPSSLEPRPLDSLQKGMLGAFKRYRCQVQPQRKVPEVDEQYRDVMLALGHVYLEAQHWEEAATVFRELAFDAPKTEVGVIATQLYLQALNVLTTQLRGSHEGCLGRMASELPRLQSLYCGSGESSDTCLLLARVRFDVERKKAEEIVRLADQMRAKGKGSEALSRYRRAADIYLGLWRGQCEMPLTQRGAGVEVPAQCNEADEVLYNMAKAYQAGHLLAKSLRARKLLVNPKYGLQDTPLAHQALYEIGKNYQAIAVYDLAAEHYDRYAVATRYRGKNAGEALSDAVVLLLGLGRPKDALASAATFRRNFGDTRSSQAARISYAVAAHYAEQQDWEGARRRLTRSLSSIDQKGDLEVRVQAHALLGRVYARLGRPKNAAREYRRTLALWSDPEKAVATIAGASKGTTPAQSRAVGRALQAVGEALFFFAERKKAEVDSVKFPVYGGPGSRKAVLNHVNTKVLPWVQAKHPLISEAAQAYKKILDLQPAVPPRWAIAAGARVGRMWGSFVEEFRSAPIPDSIRQDPELRMLYYESLDRASESLKLRAKDAYQLCLDYSVRYQYFDRHSRSCEEWLATNHTAEFHLVDELHGRPSHSGTPLWTRARPLGLGGYALKAPTR